MTPSEIEVMRDAAALIRLNYPQGDATGVLFRIWETLDAQPTGLRSHCQDCGKAYHDNGENGPQLAPTYVSRCPRCHRCHAQREASNAR